MSMSELSAEEALSDILKSQADVASRVETFVIELKRRSFESSLTLSQETFKLIRYVIQKCHRKTSVEELLMIVRGLGIRLVRARPLELVVGNCFRRVIFVIKEEYAKSTRHEHGMDGVKDKHLRQDYFRESVRNLRSPKAEANASYMSYQFKNGICSLIDEMLDEMEILYSPIGEQALEHIHANEVILVYGKSTSVEHFLGEARRKGRNFRVVVAEAAPGYSGHESAKKLSSEFNIPTTVISDGAIFAMMARVNKVIIGTHSVMANGGLLATSGMHMVALAAKHHAVPVICVTGLYKLCPLFANNRYEFIDLKSPGNTLSYSQLGSASDSVQVVTPSCDYVPPNLISLFVTNTGGHHPSYIYRLLSEYYDVDAEDELVVR